MKNLIILNNNLRTNETLTSQIKPLWYCKTGKDFLEIDCDGRIRFCSYLNDLVHPNLTIFDLKKDYYQNLRYYFEKRLKPAILYVWLIVFTKLQRLKNILFNS